MMRVVSLLLLSWITTTGLSSADAPRDQPLAANAARVIQAMESLGVPFPDETRAALDLAIADEDARAIHQAFEPHTLFEVSINPELRVKVRKAGADPVIQQSGFAPFLVRVNNDGTVTRELNIDSPQAGSVYAGASPGTLLRQAQTELGDNENKESARRFLSIDIHRASPMTPELSGHSVEYVIALISGSEAGSREATVVFDIGEGTQDLGFRSEVPVLFQIAPAIPMTMRIRDTDGQPTTARLEFRDTNGRVYPPQAKRLAPDFFFQPQIYRADGDTVLLPPGTFELTSSRGPEYRRSHQTVEVTQDGAHEIDVELRRWIDPMQFGFYSGDHHIHGAGCSHYTNPTEGVTPQDMFAQVKGEGLNVGCVLTWGPCFDHQRKYFSPIAADISEGRTLLKYDLEISGFGSAALGHVCLLNLANQTYPGSEGKSDRGWPSWTVPVLRWTKDQGGVTGYPHSALAVVPKQAGEWLLSQHDDNSDDQLDAVEAAGELLPEEFATIDSDSSGQLSATELSNSAARAAEQIPNTALPSMNGGGAMEIFVSTAEGVCDFISAMDTPRIAEWNPWYHLMNCGMPLKLSGETDFPCMSSRRVGQGRVYVQMGRQDRIHFPDWCQGIADGRAYVSDGFAHALAFEVNETAPGTTPLQLAEAATVHIVATVAFSPEVPRAVAYGTEAPDKGKWVTGDTVNLHAPRNSDWIVGGERRVEIVVNGKVVESKAVDADGEQHDLEFDIPVSESSWIALRQFPQLHTNPVTVLIGERPIRASRASAIWCAEATQLLWHNRQRFIKAEERPAAKESYERAIALYLKIAGECADDGLTIPELPLDPILE